MARLAFIRWFRGLIPTFIILFLMVCAGSLVWVSVIGLPDSVKKLLEDELGKQGVLVEMGHLRVSIWGGIVLEARDVTVHNKFTDHQGPSKIERLRLDLDMESIWAGKFRLDRVEIVDGEMVLPFTKDSGCVRKYLTLNKLDAVLIFDADDNINIREADGILQGMKVHVDGKILADSTGSTSFTQQDIDRIMHQLEQVVDYVDEVLWPLDGPPAWKIRIAENNQTPGQTRVVVEMEAPYLEYRGVEVRDVILDAEYAGDFLWVKKFMCRESVGRGKFDLMTRVDLTGRAVQVWLRSEVPLVRWAKQISGGFKVPFDIALKSTPNFVIGGSLEFTENWEGLKSTKVGGRLTLGRFDVSQLQFDRFFARFNYNNGDFYISDLNLAQGRQSLTGQVMGKDRELSVELRSTLSADTFVKLAHEFSEEKVELPEGYEIRGDPDFLVKGKMRFYNGWNALPHVETGRVILRLDDFAAMGVDLGSIALNAEIEGKKIIVRQCTIRNGDRKFDFSGESKGDDIYFSCTSDIPPSLLNRFVDDFFTLPAELKLPENADFRASGVVSVPNEGSPGLKQLSLALKTDGWKWNELDFNGLDIDVKLDGNSLTYGSCRILRGEKYLDLFASGDIRGDMFLTGRTTVRIDLFDKLLNLGDDDFFFTRFKYTDQSAFDISFLGNINLSNPLESYGFEAIVKAGRTYYRDVLVNSAQTNVRIDPNIVTMTNARMQINNNPHLAERNIRGGTAESQLAASRVVLDFNKNTAVVEGLQSTVYPDYALKMFSMDASKALSEFTFFSPVTINGTGVFPMGDDFSMMKSSLTFSTRGSQVNYPLLGTVLQMSKVSGSVSVTPDWVKVQNLNGNIWGGSFIGETLDIQIDHGNAINGSLHAKGMKLNLIGRSYGIDDMNSADVEVTVSFRSKNGSIPTITGGGSAYLRNGNIVEIPLFGALGKAIGALPGLGQFTNYKISEADCDYYFDNGYIRAARFEAGGSNMELSAISGSVNLVTTRVDALLQLRFRQLPGLLTSPFYILSKRLFKIKGVGPLSNVDWYPAPFSSDKKN